MRLTLAILATFVAVAPAAAQDYHFTKNLAAGERLEVSNINGNIDVSRAAGRVAEVTVTKVVKRGDGSMVKAIMEDGGSGMRVCTIYLNRDPNRHTCDGDNNNYNDHGRDHSEVEMRYVVHVPAGARLDVNDVNGNVTVTGVGGDSRIETVNGDVNFDGVGASSLETVNGKVIATFGRGNWDGTMSVTSVNGSLDLTFPADLSADISGETVNGGVRSDFPITIDKGWGPKSFNGRIGGGGRKLKLETVNGEIILKKQ
jgi:Putative adhesin